MKPGAYDAAREAIDAGKLDILYSAVTLREASAATDRELRERKLHILTTLGRPVRAAGFIIGISRFGEGRLCSEASAAAIEAMRVGNDDHSKDALVAITAQYEGCALLTEEGQKKLRGRARRQGIEVLNCEELLAEFGFTGSGSASA